MPKRDDIHSVLVIGSGPIVIGQAAEFDYSGTQACRVLREEGIRVILVNPNPATIMTDPDFADATYIEPITSAVLETIIAKEKPDAILPTLGGQTALNAAIAAPVVPDAVPPVPPPSRTLNSVLVVASRNAQIRNRLGAWIVSSNGSVMSALLSGTSGLAGQRGKFGSRRGTICISGTNAAGCSVTR